MGLGVLLTSLGYCQLEKMLLWQFVVKLEAQDMWNLLESVLLKFLVVSVH